MYTADAVGSYDVEKMAERVEGTLHVRQAFLEG